MIYYVVGGGKERCEEQGHWLDGGTYQSQDFTIILYH